MRVDVIIYNQKSIPEVVQAQGLKVAVVDEGPDGEESATIYSTRGLLKQVQVDAEDVRKEEPKLRDRVYYTCIELDDVKLFDHESELSHEDYQDVIRDILETEPDDINLETVRVCTLDKIDRKRQNEE